MKMVLCCHLDGCPWHTNSNFCNNPLVVINQSGYCGTIYNNQGMIKVGWQKRAREDQEELKRAAAADQELIETGQSEDQKEVPHD